MVSGLTGFHWPPTSPSVTRGRPFGRRSAQNIMFSYSMYMSAPQQQQDRSQRLYHFRLDTAVVFGHMIEPALVINALLLVLRRGVGLLVRRLPLRKRGRLVLAVELAGQLIMVMRFIFGADHILDVQ